MKMFLTIVGFLLSTAVSVFAQEISSGNYIWKDGFYKIYDLKRIDSILIIKDKNDNKYYQIDSFPSVLAQRIKKIGTDTGRTKEMYETINIEFTDWGTQQFKRLTEEMNGKKLGFVIDNELVFAPTVFGVIPDGVVALTSTKNRVDLEVLIEKIKKGIYKGE